MTITIPDAHRLDALSSIERYFRENRDEEIGRLGAELLLQYFIEELGPLVALYGAFSEINAMCCPQTHLFEDRVMKIDHVRIGQRVTIGARSTVLYGASVQDRRRIGPLPLVMKGESIPGGSVWTGNPAMPVVA